MAAVATITTPVSVRLQRDAPERLRTLRIRVGRPADDLCSKRDRLAFFGAKSAVDVRAGAAGLAVAPIRAMAAVASVCTAATRRARAVLSTWPNAIADDAVDVTDAALLDLFVLLRHRRSMPLYLPDHEPSH